MELTDVQRQKIYLAELKRLKTEIAPIAKFIDLSSLENDAFNVIFARIFTSDSPAYEMGNGSSGAHRSNWTYYTAGAMSQTAKICGYDCRFECNGKRDAAIQTTEETPSVVLYAEWEWDYEDIFSKGKELDKLRFSCRASKTADAFLLTYFPADEFPQLVSSVVKYWQAAFSGRQDGPILYLHSIVHKRVRSIREFDRLSTIAIQDNKVWLLSDLEL